MKRYVAYAIFSGLLATTTLAISPDFALAQSGSAVGRAQVILDETDFKDLTSWRIELVKAALQLTPDQEKYWPAVEDAIRSRAEGRQARLANVVARVGDLRNQSSIEIIRNRNPLEFLQRRSKNLAQRAGELKKLADAWEPLYQTLKPEQKRRTALLMTFVLRELKDAVEQHRLQLADDDED
jgi:hypothetical protein